MTLNLNSLTDRDSSVRMLAPLSLAFVGDTVFDLFVREMLVREADRPANTLHQLAVERVRASAQAQAVRGLLAMEFLTEEEISVLKRGRNAHAGHTPKNTAGGDYRLATGLEALFGYLYLSGQHERLQAIFDQVCDIFQSSQNKA